MFSKQQQQYVVGVATVCPETTATEPFREPEGKDLHTHGHGSVGEQLLDAVVRQLGTVAVVRRAVINRGSAEPKGLRFPENRHAVVRGKFLIEQPVVPQ